MFVERVIFIHDSLARSWLFSYPKKTSLTNPRPPPERKHDQRRKRKEKKTDRPSRVADTTEKPKKSAPNGGLVREMGPLISKKNLGLWKIIIWPESLDQLGLIYGWLGWMGWCDVFFLVLFCVSWGCFSLKMWSWICVIFFVVSIGGRFETKSWKTIGTTMTMFISGLLYLSYYLWA